MIGKIVSISHCLWSSALELSHTVVSPCCQECIYFYFQMSNCVTVFFQLLTSFCPICSHIFKTLNTINTTSHNVYCDHTINTIHVVFTQYSVNLHVSKMLKCSFHTSLPHTKIMDLSYLFYKWLNTAWQKWRPNVPNFKYSVKPLFLQQKPLKRAAKNYFNY